MAISLYDVSVANYLQTLGAVAGFLEKGRAHFTANQVDLGEVVETRLIPDMLPFRFQLQRRRRHVAAPYWPALSRSRLKRSGSSWTRRSCTEPPRGTVPTTVARSALVFSATM
jgi:Domain of unknown function (DUF1993)